MNPILHYPVRNPPHRRPNGLIMPGRLSQAGFYEPGSVQQAAVWDDFAGPVAVSGVDLLNSRTASGHGWRRHPSWSGAMCFTDAARARHNGGTIAVYTAAVEPMRDCIVSGRFWWSPSWVGAYQVGIVARANLDADTFYYCYCQADLSGGGVALARRVAGSFTSLGLVLSTVAGPTPRWANNKGGYLDLAVVLVGDLIKVFIDGVERLAVRDSNIPCGVPGLYAFTSASNTTGIHLESFSAKSPQSLQIGSQGVATTSQPSTMQFGGVRAVRSNGATLTVGPTANLAGIGNAGPFRYQWFRSTSLAELPNSRTMLRGQNGPVLDDRQALPGTTYFYRCAATDNAGNTMFTDAHLITTLAPTDKFVAFVGNSLTFGTGTGVTKESTDYPTVCLGGLGSPWTGQNYGFPSWSDNNILQVGMPPFLPYQFDPAFAKCVAVYWEGTNSLLVVNGATAAARTLESCAYLKALGYQVVVCNVIDRQQTGVPGDMATRISDYNTALLSGYSAVADAHVDLHVLLPDSTDTTNFQTDKVHLKATGYAIVAGAVQTAVAAL